MTKKTAFIVLCLTLLVLFLSCLFKFTRIFAEDGRNTDDRKEGYAAVVAEMEPEEEGS